MATVLLTRPEADAQRAAETLRAAGQETIISPVLEVRQVAGERPPGDFAAIVATSANAAAWLAGEENRRLLSERPVFAVGDRTAASIRSAGYAHVSAAAGTGRDLAALIAQTLPPPARLLFPVGRHHGEEWQAALKQGGYEIAPVVVYEAAAAEQLSAEAVAGLRYDVIDAVLHYSPRSARVFIELAERAGARDKLARVKHVCLSPAILASLPDDLRRAGVAAEATDETALFAALEKALAEPARDNAEEEAAPARARRAPRPRAHRVIDGEAQIVAESLRDDGSPPAETDISADAVRTAPALPIHEDAAAGDRIDGGDGIPPAPGAEAGASGAARSSAPSPGDAKAQDEWRDPAGRREPAPAARPSLLAPLFAGAVAGAIAGGCVYFLASSLTPRTDAGAAIETRLAGFAERADVAATQQKIDGLAAALRREQAALKNELSTLAQRFATPGPPSDDPDARRAAAANAQAIQQASQRLQALEQQVAALARGAAQPPEASAAAKAVRRQALAGALAQSLARGGDYRAELDALKSLGASAAQAAALAPFAGGGAPSVRALADEFRALAPKLAQAQQPEGPQASLLDRALGGLKQLVRIRPLGEARGEGAATLIARIEDALSRGSLAEATAAFDRLPEPLRGVGASWRQRAQARIDAGAAAQAMLDDATRALAAPSN